MDALFHRPDAARIPVSTDRAAPGRAGALWGDDHQSVSGGYGARQHAVPYSVIRGVGADADGGIIPLLPVPGESPTHGDGGTAMKGWQLLFLSLALWATPLGHAAVPTDLR